ncbi:MAG: hypothetical protein F6K09_09800 [Merismopedia sp. SIO2A8]|nr:hypothetical protein [Merismopedia sp. SIO2A8]
MLTTVYYLLRSRQDGSYLVARSNAQPLPQTSGDRPEPPKNSGYLIVFQEYADGLSYLNAHAPDLASDFAVESMTQAQLKTVMQRLQFQGIGLVSDPLLPKVEFMSR